MRCSLKTVVIAVCLIGASGCPQPTADMPSASKRTLANENDRSGADADSSQPRFESELTYHSQTSDGATTKGTYRSTHYRDGKAIRSIQYHASTFRASETELPLRVEVKFLTYREGKDVYRITYARPLGSGLKTTTHELEYIGKSIIVLEDELVKYTLQPPTEESISELKGVESGEVKEK
ncbi:MAG: hypothetical protein MUC83_17730 [Pirellula sp.]|nr:hypothetical protein [Pirellula sp.]